MNLAPTRGRSSRERWLGWHAVPTLPEATRSARSADPTSRQSQPYPRQFEKGNRGPVSEHRGKGEKERQGLGVGGWGKCRRGAAGIEVSYMGRVGTAYRPRGDGRWLGWHAVPTLPETVPTLPADEGKSSGDGA